MNGNGKAPELLALCAGLVVLLGAFSLLSARTRGAVRASDDPVPMTARGSLDASPPGLAPIRSTAEREARAEARGGAIDGAAAEAAPATVVGRCILDGRPPVEGGWVRFHSGAGNREGSVPIDPGGRFSLGAVPGTGLRLSFEIPSPDQRLLLLPELELLPGPGRAIELELDWKSKHVNLRVVGDAAGWNRADVQVSGPGLDARFETGDDGRAALSLVGTGRFTFRATLPTGRRGEAALELDGESDLESVLIRAGDP